MSAQVCAVGGCEKPSRNRGWCVAHYTRWKRNGDPLAGRPTGLSTAERFWSHVDKSAGPSACWLWTASRSGGGYGYFKVQGKNQRAHRVAWFLAYGQWPKETIDHVRERGCVHRHCVNVDHLEDVPGQVNTLRGDTFQAKNAAKTHCPQGHPYDGDNLLVSGGARYCRVCHRRQNLESLQRARAKRMVSA